VQRLLAAAAATRSIYGVSFATSPIAPSCEWGLPASFSQRLSGLGLFIPWRVGAEESRGEKWGGVTSFVTLARASFS